MIPGNLGGLGQPTPYAASGGDVHVHFTMPAAAVNEAFDGRTQSFMVKKPRTVQAATETASKQNYGRREAAALQLEPGTLFA